MAGISLTTARSLLSPCAKTAQMGLLFLTLTSHKSPLWLLSFMGDILPSNVASVLGQPGRWQSLGWTVRPFKGLCFYGAYIITGKKNMKYLHSDI